MNLNIFFKSIIEQDRAPIVICDLEHTVIYMNPSAVERYKRNLIGQSLKDCHNAASNEMIDRVISWFKASEKNNSIFTYHNEKENKDIYMVALRNDSGNLIGYYEKHEYRTLETSKRYDF